jgi:hypothetical protein
MRKVIAIGLILSIILIGCSNKGSTDGKYNFDEEEFTGVYEDINNKNLPTNVSYLPELIRLEKGNQDEAVSFLKVAEELIGEEEISRLRKSLENDEDNIPQTIQSDKHMMNVFNQNGTYTISITPHE